MCAIWLIIIRLYATIMVCGVHVRYVERCVCAISWMIIMCAICWMVCLCDMLRDLVDNYYVYDMLGDVFVRYGG